MLFRQVEQVQSESHRHQPCIQKLKFKKYPKLKFRKRDHFSFVPSRRNPTLGAMVEHQASEQNTSPAMSSIPGRSTFFFFFKVEFISF